MNDHYARVQVALHWVVAALVGVQWATSDAIHRTHVPDVEPTKADLVEHAVHNYGGMAIGLLMMVRLSLRLRLGAPAPLGRGWTARLAHATHLAFYAALLAQAATGFVASYVWGGAGMLHAWLWNGILALLALHGSGVALHLLRDPAALARRGILPRLP